MIDFIGLNVTPESFSFYDPGKVNFLWCNPGMKCCQCNVCITNKSLVQVDYIQRNKKTCSVCHL